MDLGDVMRELGLDVFSTSQSSARGRAHTEDEPPMEGLEDPAEPFEETADAAGAAGAASPSTGAGQPAGVEGGLEETEPQRDGDGDADVDIDDSEAILDRLDDISHEIGELSSAVESNESTIRSLRTERDEVLDRLEQIEDTNATLLGVYDRLTSEVNPFAADWDERYDREMSEQDGPRFGVIEAPEEDIQTLAQPEAGSGDGGGHGGVSFEDLKTKHGEGRESAEDAEQEDDDGPSERPEPVEDDEPEADDPGETDGGSATLSEPTDPPAAFPDDEPVGGVSPGLAAGESDQPYLTRLAPTYATEVLVLEWLSMLIDTAGPAGAMKALDFYERINWISPEIKRQCEDVLSGARHEGEGPARPPSDLSAEEHNRSFAHIMRLAQQSQLARSREG